MLSEQAQSVLNIMQQRPMWVVRVDQQAGCTFGLRKADIGMSLADLPVAIFDELSTAGLIQQVKVYRILEGRFTICMYQIIQH